MKDKATESHYSDRIFIWLMSVNNNNGLRQTSFLELSTQGVVTSSLKLLLFINILVLNIKDKSHH